MKPYYQDEAVTIYHGDCREILPSLPKVDLVLTDPPYGLNRSDPVRKPVGTMMWDARPPDSDLLDLVRSKADKVIIWGGNYFPLPPCQRFLIWDKVQPENFSTSMVEMAWSNLSGPAKLFKDRVIGFYKEHPTEKSLDLMCWCLSLVSDAQTILDPFMGSGTTLRAAKDLGRKAIGIEIEEKYCEIAAKRMAQQVLEFTA